MNRDIPRFSRRALWVALVMVIAAAVLWLTADGSAVSAGHAPEGAGDGMSWSATFIGLIRWVQGQGLLAAVWLVVLQAVLVILVIPGPYFTLGAGFLFGLAGGSLIAVLGSTLGAVLAYWFGSLLHAARHRKTSVRFRRGLGEDDQTGAHPHELPDGSGESRWWTSHPRLHLLARVVRDGGWKMVLATRLLPFFPFKLSNYVFGWMRFPFAAFFWGTLLGLIPITMVSVSAGALVSDLSGLANPGLITERGWAWSLATLGLGVVVLLWAGGRARALYREALREEEYRQEVTP